MSFLLNKFVMCCFVAVYQRSAFVSHLSTLEFHSATVFYKYSFDGVAHVMSGGCVVEYKHFCVEGIGW